MTPTSDYKKAYDSARQELADLLLQQEKIEKRLVLVRKSLQTFAELCENEGIEIKPSEEAAALLEDSTLADEVRTLLSAHSGIFFRVGWLKDELERLGHDLSRYGNPQSTIQMVLKRMVQAGYVEEKKGIEDGKFAYAMVTPRWVETARQSRHPADHIRQRRAPVSPGASGNIRQWMALHESAAKKK